MFITNLGESTETQCFSLSSQESAIVCRGSIHEIQAIFGRFGRRERERAIAIRSYIKEVVHSTIRILGILELVYILREIERSGGDLNTDGGEPVSLQVYCTATVVVLDTLQGLLLN